MAARRILFALSISVASFALSPRALAEGGGTQVIAQTPTGQVVAEGCSAVIVDPRAAPGAIACPPVAPAQPTVAAPTAKKKWYGWQTLIADGAALSMLFAGSNGNTESAALPLLALGTYVVGAPVVHAANGSAGKMGISLGIRVGAPLTLGYGLYALSRSGNEDSWAPVIMGGLGALAGIVGAVVIDAAVLARKTVPTDDAASSPKEEPSSSPPTTTGFRITPALTPTRGGGTIGAVGTF